MTLFDRFFIFNKKRENSKEFVERDKIVYFFGCIFLRGVVKLYHKSEIFWGKNRYFAQKHLGGVFICLVSL